MKLLQINSTLNWGSTGRIAEEIGQTVIAKGWKSYIAYGRYCNESASQPIRIGEDKDVYNHVLQSRLFDNHGLASQDVTRHFVKQIKELDPDIIHIHNVHGYYLNYRILFDFLLKADIPVVWTLHDCWAFTGHCVYYSFAGCQRWRTLCHDCPQKKEYPSSWLIDSSEQNYRDKLHSFTSLKNLVLVPVSEWLADEVRQSFLKNYPIRVIHNGIDTDVFTPMHVNKSKLGLDDKFVVLGVASVWSPRKGLADFIKLRKKLSDNYLIVLIGLNEKQIKSLPKGILGIRRTNSVQELAMYYSVADVYVNTSVEETFGLTTTEALSCGTPTIVYNATACPETVTTETGFVVEQGDLVDMVNKIDWIKQQGKAVYTEVCRNRAVELYDKKNRYSEYLKLYEELLN